MVNQKDYLRIEKLKKKARRYSITEGIFASAKTSVGDNYISPFAIAINSSNSIVALLGSLHFLGSLSQIFSSRLIEKYSRKKIILNAVFIEALMWLPFIAIAFLFYYSIISEILPLLILLSFAFYTIVLNITPPAWFSWMGDITDEKKRGRWFSRRNLIIGFVAVVLGIFAAIFLDYFKKNNWTMWGFAILFSLALLFRLASLRIFRKQYEPKIKLEKGYYFSFWDFMKKAPTTNFGNFAIFRLVFSFTLAISSPLIAVYLLRNLDFSYTTYITIILSGTIMSLVFMGLWGRISDKYGNYAVLHLTTIFIPLVPILWILSSNPFYLIFVPSAMSGIFFAGFNLAERNFIYDNVSQQRRGLASSYYNMCWGIGISAGALLSAVLIKIIKTDFAEPIVLIFILGSIARMIAVFWWMPKLREIKKTAKFSKSRVIKDLILKQAKPTFIEDAHEIMSIKKYFTD